ncbi:hypothetical protein GAQ27_12825 [Bacteroides uniformis]|uniref:Uncharacterized protein n=1 Tax=Bacteroides uniformis TaxID=820 RepID=A0A7J5H471_BACUN|nr:MULTISPECIES: CFI-box-CTERM domain-containing protein [Bacteroidales]KAB4164016.1 hypothetical protein GAQ27_12825 [Bacteroides uniformis]KAB4172573.1 hypothetical protein GAQ31_13615 [Bacteroides uniformis]KAB4184784.1 hypothetical protein GAQ34_12180 [Bacteroides uniformis]MCL1609462.1 hypothetical protein [Marseilla massiliensis]
MDIINKNPYRYLGVYSNSPTKERIANKAKMNAYLKVGKSVSFPLDLLNILPSIDRSIETVANAESELTLPIEQIRFAQFWWMNVTSLDGIAFNHLTNGNMDMAKSIWEKKNDVSSLQNRFLLSIINDDWNSAIQYAENLYTNFSEEFIAKIIGEAMPVSTPLWKMFIDSLAKSGVNLLPFIDTLTNTEWRNYISEITIVPLIDSIKEAIDLAKSSKGKGPQARFKAGEKLMASTKSALNQIKKSLPVSDIRYQTIADKLATEILQCGIDYFNDTEDDDAPQKAMILQNYALSIAVGKLTKDRCKENVDILKSIGKEYLVRKELAQLTTYIEELRGEKSAQSPLLGLTSFGRGIPDIARIVDKCIPLLNSMKGKLGFGSNLYMNVSSAVASSAINALVNVVNFQQTISIGDNSKLKSIISDAVKLMSTIGNMDMDTKTRNYYSGNKNTLMSIDNRLNPSGGCYIATMVYGDYDHPRVMVLREFRDSYLADRHWGRQFIKIYYKYSPKLVKKLTGHKKINHMIKIMLDIFVEHLKRNKK